MAKRYLPFDPKTAFAADPVTMTESGVVSDGEQPVVLRVGPGRHDSWLVIDVLAMATTPPVFGEGEEGEVVVDEGGALVGGYRFILQGADAEDFDTEEGDATKIVNLAVLDLGAASALLAGATDQGPGRYAIPVANEIKQQFADCTFVRLFLQVTPTVEGEGEEGEPGFVAEVPESITFKAWLSKEPHA